LLSVKLDVYIIAEKIKATKGSFIPKCFAVTKKVYKLNKTAICMQILKLFSCPIPFRFNRKY